MSLSHGILLMSLNDDVISRMHRQECRQLETTPRLYCGADLTWTGITWKRVRSRKRANVQSVVKVTLRRQQRTQTYVQAIKHCLHEVSMPSIMQTTLSAKLLLCLLLPSMGKDKLSLAGTADLRQLHLAFERTLDFDCGIRKRVCEQ
jgi:hypothetical protein